MLRRSSVVCEKTQSCPELLQFATGEMMGGGRQKELLAASKKSCCFGAGLGQVTLLRELEEG
jgi:hypothetical protein